MVREASWPISLRMDAPSPAIPAAFSAGGGLGCAIYKECLIFLPAGSHCGVVYLPKGNLALLGSGGHIFVLRLAFAQPIARTDFYGDFPINGADLAELGV